MRDKLLIIALILSGCAPYSNTEVIEQESVTVLQEKSENHIPLADHRSYKSEEISIEDIENDDYESCEEAKEESDDLEEAECTR